LNDINPTGIQVESNPYDRQLAKCLASCASAADATEAVLRSYVDGAPKFRGKQKLSRAALDAAFWSSAMLSQLADEWWTSELMVLALTRYFAQERTLCPEAVKRVAACAPGALILAIRYSSLVLRPQSAHRTELDQAASTDPQLRELCAVLDIFAKAYGERLAALDRTKAALSALTAFELLLYASLYAFEHLVPTTFDSSDPGAKPDAAVEVAWDAINDLLVWKLQSGSVESLALSDDKIGRAIKAHLSPSLFPDAADSTDHRDLCLAFGSLMAAQIELNEFASRSADAFSYDDGIRFVRQGDRLELEEIDASVQAAWDRESRKLERLHGYWFNRALVAFANSELSTQRIGRPENEDFNRVAYIRAMQSHLRLTEVYGVADTVTTEAGEHVDLFQALLSLDLMSAFFLRDVLASFTQHLQQTGHWRAALATMAIEGLRNGMENRFPLIWSDRDVKVDRIVGWTVCPAHPQGSKRAAAVILDFWTNDLVRLAEKLQRSESALHPELFERPVLRFGKNLVQLPWVVGMQNNSSAAVNNLRRLGARRSETKSETHQIEVRLGRLFESKGFRVVFNWEPSEKEVGEVDLICARDGIVLVLEVKSTFIRRSQREAWLHATTTLRKAGQQLQRKLAAVKIAMVESLSLREALDLSPSNLTPNVHGWIVDTSIERDHCQFDGFLKVSLEEIQIALRDDRQLLNYHADRTDGDVPDDVEGSSTKPGSSLYPTGFSGKAFVDVIRTEAVWQAY
jgi:Holliday junction resolvase-like predicted endonuclease